VRAGRREAGSEPAIRMRAWSPTTGTHTPGVHRRRRSLSAPGRAGKERARAGGPSERLFFLYSHLEAALALDVHEVRVGRLDEAFQLVAAGLEGGGRVEEVDVVGGGLLRKKESGKKEAA